MNEPFSCSVFEGLPIPYPKREFLTDDDNEDKPNTGASKVRTETSETSKISATMSSQGCSRLLGFRLFLLTL